MKRVITILISAVFVVTLSAEKFIKVTDATTLKEGDKVLLGSATHGKVSGGFQSNNESLRAEDAVFVGDTVKLDDPVYLTLKSFGDYWNLYVGTKPIGHHSGQNEFEAKHTIISDFSIIIKTDTAQITSRELGKNNAEISFHYNSSSPRFALYGDSFTGAAAVELYRLDETSIAEIRPMMVNLDKERADIRMDETLRLTATITPEDAVDQTVTWGSTDPTVAIVSDGVVTPISLGETKIWVKTNTANKTDTCVVQVFSSVTTETAVYNAVQKAEYLPTGAKVFFGTAKTGEEYIMGQYALGGNSIKGVSATYGEKRHSVEACLQYAYTVVHEGDYYLFVDHDGKYLRPTSETKLGSGENDDYAKWTLDTIKAITGAAVLTAINGKHLYNNHQGANDLFNIYDSIGDGRSLANIILYSSAAPEWDEHINDSWIKVDTTFLEWGEQRMDSVTRIWADNRKVIVSVKNLPTDAQVTMKGDESFHCGWTEIKKSRTTPAELTVFWEAEQVGEYNGQLIISCVGVDTIVINLHAKAIGPTNDPEFSASKDSLTLVLNEANNYSDLQGFTFSANYLSKRLYCKWEHDGSKMFNYQYENKYVEIMVGDDYVFINSSVTFDAYYTYTDVDVLVSVEGRPAPGVYSTKLHFYSYKLDSNRELAIDEVIPIKVVVEGDPHEAIDAVNTEEATATKIIRDGQVLIIRNNKVYNTLGARVSY